ncbi:MAG TPA: prepilin peptidase [Polyangiaceae bacterium]|nr:prepilin peptidase [Polyangiaceae bacterium]
MALADFPPVFLLVLAGMLGLLFGSFANVVIYRLPRGENLAYPASHCPACGAPIKPYHNLPLFGFLWLRGRASCCKAPIPWRYPAVELLGGLWALAVMRVVVLDLPGPTPIGRVGLLFALYLALGIMLLCAIFIDLDHMLLPDALTLGGAALGLVSAPLRDRGLVDSVLGAGIGFVVVWLLFVEGYRLLRGFPGMGLGDAKLLALTGAWFGWRGVLFALFAGSILGTLTFIAVYAARGKVDEPESVTSDREELERELELLTGEERAELERELAKDPLFQKPGTGIMKARLAFGPFLAVATLAYLFVGPALIDEYLLLMDP